MRSIRRLIAFSSLRLAAFSRAALVPPGTNCTEAESTSVTWDIQNFTVDTNTEYDFGPGTLGRAAFSIRNSANGYEFDCLQGDGVTGRVPNRYLVNGTVWYSCNVYCSNAKGAPDEVDPPLATSFHFDMDTKSLSINQVWSCSSWNRVVVTNYTGTGFAVISNLACSQIPQGRPDQVSCAPTSTLIKATNVSTVNITESVEDDSTDEPDNDPYTVGDPGDNPFGPTFYPEPGVAHDTAGCNELSQNPSFKVTNFYWSPGAVSFVLRNDALNYTQRCNLGGAAQLSEQGLQSASWWNCTRFDPMHVDYPANSVYTSLLYGGSRNILGVNQTWYCDSNTTEATVYSAYGEAHFPLKCNETRYCLPASEYDYDQRPQKIVNDLCGADDLTIVPKQQTSFQVSKEQASEDFKPRGYNCSTKSLELPGIYGWDITSLTLNRTYVPGDPGLNSTAAYTDIIEFYYNNTATDNDWPRNTGWRQCLYLSDDATQELNSSKHLMCMMSFEPFTLGFSFNNITSELGLRQNWTCDGIDSDHTNTFGASGSTQISLQCHTVGNDTRCATISPFTVPIVNISSILNSAS